MPTTELQDRVHEIMASHGADPGDAEKLAKHIEVLKSAAEQRRREDLAESERAGLRALDDLRIKQQRKRFEVDGTKAQQRAAFVRGGGNPLDFPDAWPQIADSLARPAVENSEEFFRESSQHRERRFVRASL